MSGLRRILCPVDFSEPSERALTWAAKLASRLGAQLDLLHAYQLPIYVLPDGATIPGAELDVKVSTEAQRHLDEWGVKHRAGGLEGRNLVTSGLAPQEVARLVEELGSGLVVMGTHGRTGLMRMLIGSVTARVVRSCPVPVISVPPGDPPTDVDSILCPVDFSQHSEEGARFAVTLAEALGARRIRFLNVMPPQISTGEDFSRLLDSNIDEATEAQHRRDLEALARRHSMHGLDVSHEVLRGYVHQGIADSAREHRVDLIVMATHGRTGIGHFLLGSVAERVVRTAPVPVCTVRVRAD